MGSRWTDEKEHFYDGVSTGNSYQYKIVRYSRVFELQKTEGVTWEFKTKISV